MNTTTISCSINTTNPSASLGVEVWIDDRQIYNNDHLTEKWTVSHNIPDDDDCDHVLKIVLKNKTSADTKIDADGNIIEDARIVISDLVFDEIDLGQIFYDHAVYTHDRNGSGETVSEKFYGEMGCNGTVSLPFNTPIYLWLLENM